MFASLPIRQKLTAILVSVSIGVLLVACATFVVFDRVSTMQNKTATLSILCRTMAQTLKGPVAFGDADSTRTVLEPLGAEPTLRWGAVYGADGSRLAEWHPNSYDGSIPHRTDKLPNPELMYDLMLSTPIAGPNGAELGTLVVRFSTEDVTRRAWVFMQIAFGIMVVATTIVIGLANQLRKTITRPVDALAASARRVESGDYAVRVADLGGDELGQLGHTFNAMLDGIADRDAELMAHQEQLEGLVAERTADLERRNHAMRMVLDNVQQGLTTLDPEGRISPERSAAFDQFFGVPGAQATLGDVLESQVQGTGQAFEVAWETLAEDVMPRMITLPQLPSSFELGERYLTASYLDLASDADPFAGVLAVFSDVTEQRAQERSVRQQGELIQSFQAMRTDPKGYQAFVDDARTIVGTIEVGGVTDPKVLHRLVHTLKGNSGLYGLVDVPERCHALETALAEGREPDPGAAEAVVAAWKDYEDRMSPFRESAVLRLGPEEVGALDALAHEVPALGELLRQWRAEPVRARLENLAMRCERLAGRRDKDVQTQVEDNGVRLTSTRFDPLWQVLVHLVRNAVDHGIETRVDRLDAGKPGCATIAFRSRRGNAKKLGGEGFRLGKPPGAGPAIAIDIEDDGRGIDFDAIRALGKRRGREVTTDEACIELLFEDGVTTRAEVSELSGRGVGTSAVLHVVQSLEGFIEVHTTQGHGTRVTVVVPLVVESPQPAQARVGATVS